MSSVSVARPSQNTPAYAVANPDAREETLAHAPCPCLQVKVKKTRQKSREKLRSRWYTKVKEIYL